MKKTKKALVTLAIMGMATTLVPFNVFAATGVTTGRIGGTDRYQTANTVADLFATPTTAILAPSADAHLVDALAAAPLAGTKAPILLTESNTLTAATKTELAKLIKSGVKTVYVVGAIDEAVRKEVATMGVTATALKGADRIGTAVKIAAQLINPRGSFVVGFDAVADALSVASYAAANNYSILVANPDGSLPASEAAYKGDKVYTVGGKSLVADIAGATRLAGVDRYATNKAVLDILGYTNISKAYVANGTPGHLVDSLVASSLAALAGAPIVLTDTVGNGDATAADINAKLANNASVVALGGETIVTSDTVNKVAVPPVAATLTVSSVSAVNQSVVNGAALALPTTVNALVSSETKTLAVTWNAGTPTYSATTAGTYVFSGVLTMPTGITNPNNVKATATVTVAPAVVLDTTAPVISLKGVSPMNLNVGDTFTDPGTTVTDNVDTNLVATAVSTVDTTKAGSYTVKYNVSDKAGNAAAEVTRTVVVAVDPQVAIVKAATDAVTGYEGAPVVTSDDVTAAEALEATASTNVNLVTDATTKADLTTRISNKKADVDAVKADLAAAALLAKVAAEVDQYTALANGDLTTQTLVDTAKNAGVLARLDVAGLDGDIYWQDMAKIAAADILVNAAQKALDSVPPVITLNGGATITVNVGDTYTELGATVTDNVDTNLVAKVTGGVDTSIAGTYILTYNVSDNAGNAAIAVTRNVVVAKAGVDTVKPVITLNGLATMNLKVGDTFTDPGTTVTDNVDQDLIAVAVSTVDTTKAGSYTVKYDISDKAGNAAVEVTRTVVVAAVNVTTITSVVANNGTANGTVAVTLSVAPITPVIGDFKITNAAGVVITPTAIATTGSVVTLTVPTVAATAADQSVVYSVTYKDGAKVDAPAFTVAKAIALQITAVSAWNPILSFVTVTVNDSSLVKTAFDGTTALQAPLINDATHVTVFCATAPTALTLAGADGVKVALPVIPVVTALQITAVSAWNPILSFVTVTVNDSSLVKTAFDGTTALQAPLINDATHVTIFCPTAPTALTLAGADGVKVAPPVTPVVSALKITAVSAWNPILSFVTVTVNDSSLVKTAFDGTTALQAPLINDATHVTIFCPAAPTALTLAGADGIHVSLSN